MALEAIHRRYNVNKGPLNPSIGKGFTFDELVVFLEALDDAGDTLDDLPHYCAMMSLKRFV